MAEVLVLALSFPSVVFTVLLAVVLVYWVFVMVGAIHIGEGSEGALDGLDADGAVEGAAKGALEGAAKGVLEGHAEAFSAHGGADVGDVGDVGDAGDVDAADVSDGHEASALAALLSALGLRAIPVTVSGSLIITFAWMVSMISMQLVTRSLPGTLTSLLSIAVLIGAPLLALPLSAIVARPLSKVFVVRRAPSKSDLVGKTCIVRTGSVTRRFGEGLLEDGGAGLVLRIRIDGDQQLKRGDHALIVEWDTERDAFLVEPMNDILRPTSSADSTSNPVVGRSS